MEELKLTRKQADRAIRALDALNELKVLSEHTSALIHRTISCAEAAYEEAELTKSDKS